MLKCKSIDFSLYTINVATKHSHFDLTDQWGHCLIFIIVVSVTTSSLPNAVWFYCIKLLFIFDESLAKEKSKFISTFYGYDVKFFVFSSEQIWSTTRAEEER